MKVVSSEQVEQKSREVGLGWTMLVSLSLERLLVFTLSSEKTLKDIHGINLKRRQTAWN